MTCVSAIRRQRASNPRFAGTSGASSKPPLVPTPERNPGVGSAPEVRAFAGRSTWRRGPGWCAWCWSSTTPWSAGLRASLDETTDLLVVGELSTGDAAVSFVDHQPTDVVLMELS